MTLSSWLLYVSLVLLSTASPGPAVFLSLSNSLTYGMRAAVVSSLGNVSGLLVLAAITLLGIDSVFRLGPWGFLVLKSVGALYLIYLGVMRLRSADAALVVPGGERQVQAQLGPIYRQGMLVAMTNPKALLLFAALFPQFLVPGQGMVGQGMMLTATLMTLSFLALVGYALLAQAARRWLQRPRALRVLNRVFGVAFVGLGVGLLFLDSPVGVTGPTA